jgi:hypothetical protein
MPPESTGAAKPPRSAPLTGKDLQLRAQLTKAGLDRSIRLSRMIEDVLNGKLRLADTDEAPRESPPREEPPAT